MESQSHDVKLQLARPSLLARSRPPARPPSSPSQPFWPSAAGISAAAAASAGASAVPNSREIP